MEKKIVSLFTLVAFVVFSVSCYTTKVRRIEAIKANRTTGLKVISLVKKDGEWIEFTREGRGRVDYAAKAIIGHAFDKDGQSRLISVPFSEISTVKAKRLDAALTVGLVIVVKFVLPLALFYVGCSLYDCLCPFVYSYDGEEFIMEAEPFARSICKGQKRTEWHLLKHLKEVDGQYRLLLSNEVDDSDHFDELKLLAVDHPAGVQVIPDTAGAIHTAADPIAPTVAYDREGNDIVTPVCQKDWHMWQSRDERKTHDGGMALRDELIFEFPKPVGASQAKLLFAGGNTPCGAGILYRYLELYGKEAGAVYRQGGPALKKMKRMFQREELYALQVKIETDNGWQTGAVISGAPPLVPDTRVYAIDLENVSGDTLKIKLNPPAGAWMIDWLAVDYSKEMPVKVTAIDPVEANGQQQDDALDALAESDDNCLVLANQGDFVELIFQAPMPNPGMERSFILKTGGYYDIQLQSRGQPQHELLERIHSEPGFILQHYLASSKNIYD